VHIRTAGETASKRLLVGSPSARVGGNGAVHGIRRTDRSLTGNTSAETSVSERKSRTKRIPHAAEED